MDSSRLIRKTADDFRVAPNFQDYEAERRRFSWGEARRALRGLPDGGLNMAWEAVDRHVADGHGGRRAFVFLRRDAPEEALTYAELAERSNRFARVLRRLGVGKGERVFVLCGRIPELYVAVLGSLKNGSVVSPLFSAFGPEPIATRVNLGSGDRKSVA